MHQETLNREWNSALANLEDVEVAEKSLMKQFNSANEGLRSGGVMYGKAPLIVINRISHSVLAGSPRHKKGPKTKGLALNGNNLPPKMKSPVNGKSGLIGADFLNSERAQENKSRISAVEVRVPRRNQELTTGYESALSSARQSQHSINLP